MWRVYIERSQAPVMIENTQAENDSLEEPKATQPTYQTPKQAEQMMSRRQELFGQSLPIIMKDRP